MDKSGNPVYHNKRYTRQPHNHFNLNTYLTHSLDSINRLGFDPHASSYKQYNYHRFNSVRSSDPLTKDAVPIEVLFP